VKPGQEVKKGDVLVVMDNPDLRLALLSLEGQLKELDVQLTSLKKQRRFDQSAGLRVNEMEKQRDSLKEVLDGKQDELEKLTVRAPIDGIVLAVPDKPERAAAEGQLPMWSGGALNPKILGAMLRASDQICQVGDPKNLVAEVIIDQAEVDLVVASMLERQRDGKPRVPVDLMLDSLPGQVFHSELERVALAEMTETPLALASHAGGDVDTVADQSGVPRPLSTSYPAIAELPITDGSLQLGMRGKAKLYTGWQPLGRRFYRLLTRTFHFSL
jgi:putative peptide zinc metalloprotease protein